MTVISEKIWSPQEFVGLITDHCYIFHGDDDVGHIACILEESGFGELWDYPINEIESIIEHGHNVVLVDCLVWTEECGEYRHEYRWWQVPKDKIQLFQNN